METSLNGDERLFSDNLTSMSEIQLSHVKIPGNSYPGHMFFTINAEKSQILFLSINGIPKP